MSQTPAKPIAVDTIAWYHHLLATPIKFLDLINLSPIGGENSISAVIEAVLARKKGIKLGFPLSKTDEFFVNQLTRSAIPDPMIEYRELSHKAQEELLTYRGNESLGVIWLGAGVFTLAHPLIAQRRSHDWHLWSDKSPKIIQDAKEVFEETRPKHSTAPHTYEINLPEDIARLNEWIKIMKANVKRLVIFTYGVFYALTYEENVQWLKKLSLPASMDVYFVMNSPGKKIPTLPGMMAAFHKQRMVYYNTESIQQLLDECIPNCELSWKIDREDTRNNTWGTWIFKSGGGSRPRS